MRALTLILPWVLSCFLGAASADVVHRRGASALEGTVEDRGGILLVHTAKDGPIPVPCELILFVERGSAPERRETEAKIHAILRRAGSEDVEERLQALHELDAFDPGEMFRPLVRNLNSSRTGTRHLAAFRLGELGSQEALSGLVRAAIEDRDEGVRDVAFAAAMKIGHPALFVPFAKALFANSAVTRIRAARYLGAIGDRRAVEVLVRRFALAAGGGGRSSLSVLDQQAYVKDFDVEVAQAAAIADPIIGIAHSGAIFDVRVLGIHGTMTTVEKRVVAEALEDLTGESFGENPTAWVRWWRQEQARRKSEEQG